MTQIILYKYSVRIRLNPRFFRFLFFCIFMKILLVEDEEGLIITLTDRLRSEGFDVKSAGDGEQGLALALSENFDLIILDVMLPKKNGFDVLRELRAVSKMPVLMLTARGDDAEKSSV